MAGFDVDLSNPPRGFNLADPDEVFDALKELVTDTARYGRRFTGGMTMSWEQVRVEDPEAEGGSRPEWRLAVTLEINDRLQELQGPIHTTVGDKMLFAGNILQKIDDLTQV